MKERQKLIEDLEKLENEIRLLDDEGLVRTKIVTKKIYQLSLKWRKEWQK